MTRQECNLLQADSDIDQVLTEAVAQRMRCHPLQTGGSCIPRQQELHSSWRQRSSLPSKDRRGGPGMLAVAERAYPLARIPIQRNLASLTPFATADGEQPTALTEVHILPGECAEFGHPHPSVQHQCYGG